MNQPTTQMDPPNFEATAIDDFIDVVAERMVSTIMARLERSDSHGEAVEWRLRNVSEIAERLGRSERWVRQAVKDRGLPVTRLDGGGLAFDLDDVREWANARRIPAGDGDPLADRLRPVRKSAPREERRTRRRVVNQKVEP